jgi:hypothetical protein
MTQLEHGLQSEDIEIASTPPQHLNRYTSPDPDSAPSQGQSYRARNNIRSNPGRRQAMILTETFRGVKLHVALVLHVKFRIRIGRTHPEQAGAMVCSWRRPSRQRRHSRLAGVSQKAAVAGHRPCALGLMALAWNPLGIQLREY